MYVCGVVVWSMIALVAAVLGLAIVEHGFAMSVHGWSAVAASATMLVGILKIGWSAPRLANVLTVRGWRFARIACERLVKFEYWPTWLVYLPILPGLIGLAIKHRRLLAFTAVNPAISNAGGFVGERKSEILRDLEESELVARTVLVQPDADGAGRVQMARQQMAAAGLRWPVIAKPDEGERGHAVKMLRGEGDLERYLASVRGAVLVQAYAAGPEECGVLWCRREGAADGFIFSITAKEFPTLTGDGHSTLEELIERHPRHRRQHRTFLTRFASQAVRVPAAGERVSLGMAGNHCQGTKFKDGAGLIGPGLSDVINRMCKQYASERCATMPLGGLDWVRFDIRYASEQGLREGRDFVIVEMNGSSAESTNMYDPQRSVLWSYGVLWRQWKHLFALGRERMDAGGRALSVIELWRLCRAHVKQRTGSSVAD
jgi:hypothetical protein